MRHILMQLLNSKNNQKIFPVFRFKESYEQRKEGGHKIFNGYTESWKGEKWAAI